MPADERMLPTSEAQDLLELSRNIADKELLPRVDQAEAKGEFPRQVFRTLGEAGLLALPYDPEYGGGGQPFTVYLQVLEELAARWLAVALGVSVHTLATFPMANYGSDRQKKIWLPRMLGGETLGAYCLSEVESGSDAAALQCRAISEGRGWTLTGTKAWVTHGGVADFYNVMARTGEAGSRGISCFLVQGDHVKTDPPEQKMGMSSSPTAAVRLDNVQVPADRLIGAEGEGFTIALAALDAGRLGIAACAVGLAQAALDHAAAYAKGRSQFGKPIVEFQGVSFLLADMAAQIRAARALYLDAASRKDAGLSYSAQAASAKLIATDMAMSVTTDAVQVLGGAGYTKDFPLERYMREAKVLQIVEGTNQIQRLVISRHL